MLRYMIDFTIVDDTFKDTGPLEFSFYVNGHELDHVRYTTEGAKHFEKAVPPRLGRAGQGSHPGRRGRQALVFARRPSAAGVHLTASAPVIGLTGAK